MFTMIYTKVTKIIIVYIVFPYVLACRLCPLWLKVYSVLEF